MNVYDSERMAAHLVRLGYTLCDSEETADLVVVNTCAIRAKAEQKVFSYLGRLAKRKRQNPGLLIAVGGCVAQQEGPRILERAPGVDLVFGTHAIDRVARNVERVKAEGRPVVDIDGACNLEALQGPGELPGNGRVSRFVTIMQGCDNYCTYCVVPYVRGREASRAPQEIIREIEALVASGTREVTLLGQNVNSYGMKEGGCTFAELLSRIDAVSGLRRIRFTTSHPKDLSGSLIRAFGTVGKLCHHIHLPVQSGSNAILRRMNRKYTREHYLEKVDRLRRQCPDIAITSDVIVGFPGETEADFNETLELVGTVGFDSLFAFMYSDRPNAPAAHFGGKVPHDARRERLKILLERQDAITTVKNRSMVGSVQTVLVDGFSKKRVSAGVVASAEGMQWSGRTSGNKIVNFVHEAGRLPGNVVEAGDLIDIRIERALAHSLWGRTVGGGSQMVAPKGDNYAA